MKYATRVAGLGDGVDCIPQCLQLKLPISIIHTKKMHKNKHQIVLLKEKLQARCGLSIHVSCPAMAIQKATVLELNVLFAFKNMQKI